MQLCLGVSYLKCVFFNNRTFLPPLLQIRITTITHRAARGENFEMQIFLLPFLLSTHVITLFLSALLMLIP